jgi:hypothetical protein
MIPRLETFAKNVNSMLQLVERNEDSYLFPDFEGATTLRAIKIDF